MDQYQRDKECPACGHGYVNDEYKGSIVGMSGKPYGPVIQRTCGNCEYVWFERPLNENEADDVLKRRGRKPFMEDDS